MFKHNFVRLQIILGAINDFTHDIYCVHSDGMH